MRTKLLTEVPAKKINLRIKKLTVKRNSIVGNSTMSNIHKRKEELLCIDARIDELERLKHPLGKKLKPK